MKIIVWVVRIIVGLLFIFSGLVKANDPLGLSYKMKEFFEVWNMSFLDSYALAFALVMNTFEIVAGIAVIIGWRMRMFSWLLLLLIVFFTFLTGYAFLSGKIKTCGCFGDCIPLTAKQSFIKDLILLVLILFIFVKRSIVIPLFKGFAGAPFIFPSLLFCIIFQWHVLNHLPLVDCLPYKVGNNIAEQMKLPAGALPDSFVYKFKYTRNGKPLEFDENNLPADLDSTYIFVDRVQTLVRPATAKAAISDFFLYNENGEDTTTAMLGHEGYLMLLFLEDANRSEKDWTQHAKKVAGICKEKGFPFYVVTATADAAKKQLPSDNNIHYLKSDATVIKTAARTNPAFILMKGSVVVKKFANADYKKAIEKLKAL